MPATLGPILPGLYAMQQIHAPACSYTSYWNGCEVLVTHLQILRGFLYDTLFTGDELFSNVNCSALN
jgi:hypothetical protein